MNSLKDIIHISYGMAVLGKDSVKELSNKLVKEYGVSQAQAKKMADDFLKQSRQTHNKTRNMIKKHVAEILEEYDLLPKKAVKRTSNKKTSKKKVAKKKVVRTKKK